MPDHVTKVETFSYICDMLDEFIRYIEREKRFSPLTVRNYRKDIERFTEWAGSSWDDFRPDHITRDTVRRWIVWRTETGHITSASMNREVSTLRTLFRWLLATGRTRCDIMKAIPSLRTSKRLPAFVPESRMEQILADEREEDKASEGSDREFEEHRNSLIVLMLYTLGIRLAELTGIDRDDLSDDCRLLKVRGKGDKERVVPIVETTRRKIMDYLTLIERQKICNSDEKALILTRKGKRISRSTVYRIVRQELTRGGVQGKKSPHVLRHTFATHLLNGGADMREIQELLGHASLKATEVYTHNSIARLKEIYSKAHPRERGGE